MVAEDTNMIEHTFRLHVGIAPYADRDGVFRASYQWVSNQTGKAFAHLSITQGKLVSFTAADRVTDGERFKAEAMAHFKTATPNPDYRLRRAFPEARCPDWNCNEH